MYKYQVLLLFCFYLNNVSASSSIGNWGKDADCVGDVLNGTCVDPHRCLATNPHIPGLIHPLPCTLKSGQEGVCCTDCDLVHNARNAYLDKGTQGFLWKTGQNSWDKCLDYAQKHKDLACTHESMAERFVYGKCHLYKLTSSPAGASDVYRREFPHMALLGYSGTRSPSQWVCSGSLISERFLLTAGHCVVNRDLGPVTEAAFGLLSRSDPAEDWRKYRIKRAIPHPQYKPPLKSNDIALLQTEIPVVFIDRLILPACLPAFENKRLMADSLQKLQVSLDKSTDKECSEMFAAHHQQPAGLNSSTQLCSGHRTMVRDSCGGDSGAPLQDTGNPGCIHTIVGVTTYGRCGDGGFAYTKIAGYQPWIESVVWPTIPDHQISPDPKNLDVNKPQLSPAVTEASGPDNLVWSESWPAEPKNPDQVSRRTRRLVRGRYHMPSIPRISYGTYTSTSQSPPNKQASSLVFMLFAFLVSRGQ